jgi:hypothetical protein
MKAVRLLAATTLAFSSLFISQPAQASCVSVQESQTIAALDTATSESVVRTIETCGGDDTSYQVPLSVSVTFDGQQFSSVYATTNSVITFGRPDNTYWDYPTTPSISLYSMDWVVFPNRGDEHLIIQTSDGGFRVDISARPYGMWNYVGIAPTSIIITAAINSDGTVAIAYALSGPEYQSRTGVRLLDGSIVTLQDYGIVQVAEPVVLTPEPVQPTPEPTPTLSPELIPESIPTPVSPPAPAPVEEIVVPIPEATPVEELPDPEPVEEIQPTPEPVVVPTPTPEPIAPVVELAEPELPILDPELLDPETMTDEEVAELTLVAEETLLTAEPGSEAYQEALAQLMVVAQADDPQVSEALAAIPLLGDAAVAVLDAFNAVGNIGADIAPEVREKAQEVVVSSVIVGQIAATASIAAVGTSYRRIK